MKSLVRIHRAGLQANKRRNSGRVYSQSFLFGKARRARRGVGCIGCLTMLIILLLVVGAGWVFGVQPYVHSMAQTQLDNAMSKAVQQIPSQAAQLPAGSTIPVQESTITNLI